METTTKQEVKPDGSLMKKTKAQLVEIILRKDAVEKELNHKIETLNCDKDRLKTIASETVDDYEKLKQDYCDLCDNNATDYVEYNKNVRNYKSVIVGLALILAISMISNILLIL